MANGIKELNDSTFAGEIATGITLVDFWAPWCGPCRMQGPILEDVAAKVGDKASICKVNVDDAAQVATQYAIRSIPTIMVFKDGAPVKQFVGVQSETVLVSAIEDA